MRLRLLLVPALAACVGCSSAGAPAAEPASAVGQTTTSAATIPTTATLPTTTLPTATPPTTPAATGGATPAVADGTAPPDQLTLAFGGDIHFADQLEPLLSKPQTALAELRPHLGAADVAVVNLEAALTTRGSPAPKAFHFRSPPTALQALAAAGVDVVTMANNHAVDYGAKGFADTLAARAKSPVPVVGIGTNTADALRPAIVTIRGRRVAVLGATQVPDWTLATWPAGDNRPGVAAAAKPRRLADAVRRARRSADVVVVYLHWGTDYERCPNSLQRSTARALAAAGADVVVGTHAHQVQGAGWLRSTYVAYGLGNFVWWRRNSELQSRSGVLTLTVRGRRVVGERWTPMRISADGIPRVPAKADADRLLASWKRARDCTGLSSRPG